MKVRSLVSSIVGFISAVTFSTDALAQLTNDQLRFLVRDLSRTLTSYDDLVSQTERVQALLKLKTDAGSLSPAESTALQSNLSDISSQINQAKVAKHNLVSLVQALHWTRDLNKIIATLRDLELTNATTPDGIGQLRKNLTDQINGAVGAVVLTQLDANRLLADVASSGISGGLGPSAVQPPLAAVKLRAIDAHFAQMLKLAQTGTSDLNNREADLEMRIDAASRSGSVDAKTLSTLRKTLDQISAKQSSYVTSSVDGPLTIAQIYSIATLLDQLQDQIDKAGAPPSGSKPAPSSTSTSAGN